MDESQAVLPELRKGALRKNPENLIIFSRPKVGKSTLMCGLEDSLLLDVENGSDYLDNVRVFKAKSVEDIKALGAMIKEAGFPYKYIGIDTITELAPICVDYAEEIYSRLPIGKHWFEPNREGTTGKEVYGNILNLPKGAGYIYYWEAYEKIIRYIMTLAPHIIQFGHVKDSEIEKADNKFTSLDLDLRGKLKTIASSKSSAIGYLYRKGNQNILSFKTSDEVACGARPEHLSNQEIVLSEKQPDGSIKVYWDRVYIAD